MRIKCIIIFLLSFCIVPAIGQTNDLSISNGLMLPFVQRSEVNYDKYESGGVQMIRSSYFAGLTYRKKIVNTNWDLKFSIAAGEERYRIQLFNEHIDFDVRPDLIYLFQPDLETFHQTYLVSLEAERRFALRNEKYELSFFGGLYVNGSYQIRYDRLFANQFNLEIDGDQIYSVARMYMYPPVNRGFGLSTGVSLRRYFNKKLYVEFLVQGLLRNSLEYQYDLEYYYFENSDPFLIYSADNQSNRIDYSLLNLNLNLGIVCD